MTDHDSTAPAIERLTEMQRAIAALEADLECRRCYTEDVDLELYPVAGQGFPQPKIALCGYCAVQIGADADAADRSRVAHLLESRIRGMIAKTGREVEGE